MGPDPLALLQDAFRQAAVDLQAEPAGRVTPSTVRAWLVLHGILVGRRWLDASEEALSQLDARRPPPGSVAEWVLASCEAWVWNASGPGRRVAETLVEGLPRGPGATPARLAYWRISGDEGAYSLALADLPEPLPRGGASAPDAADLEAAAALWAAHQATARPELGEAARSLLRAHDPKDLPVGLWPLAADALDWRAEDVDGAVSGWTGSRPEPALVVRAAAALALPPLELWIDWWVERELQEGIVAEAATYPYPALRLRFRKLPERDQVRFTPILDGEAAETLHDAAIVSTHLDQVIEDVDLSALRDLPRRTARRTGRRP